MIEVDGFRFSERFLPFLADFDFPGKSACPSMRIRPSTSFAPLIQWLPPGLACYEIDYARLREHKLSNDYCPCLRRDDNIIGSLPMSSESSVAVESVLISVNPCLNNQRY